MSTFNFKHDFKHEISGDGTNCYLVFSGRLKQHSFTSVKEFKDKLADEIDSQQINLTLKSATGVTIISSMDYAITFTLGISDYSSYIKRLRDCCFHQTFEYNGKTYITIIKNHLLNELIHLARTSYQNEKKNPPDNIYIRVDSSNLNNNLVTNTPPTQEIAKYISMNHISTTPVDSQVSLIATLPIKKPLDEQQIKKISTIFADTEGVDVKFVKDKPVVTKPAVTKPVVKKDPYSRAEIYSWTQGLQMDPSQRPSFHLDKPW